MSNEELRYSLLTTRYSLGWILSLRFASFRMTIMQNNCHSERSEESIFSVDSFTSLRFVQNDFVSAYNRYNSNP